MGLAYQRTDRKVLDYDLWYLPDFRHPLRGPRRWREDRPYLSFAGAAQTFGRFAPDPFPAKIGRWFEVDHLNLGFAGAGPEYFLRNPVLLARINASRLCVLQAMSGRSVSTSILTVVDKGGVLKFERGPLKGQSMLAMKAYRELLKQYDEESVLGQVADAKRAWVGAYRELLDAIEVPIVLLWASRRTPRLEVDLSSAERLLGPFPQLVDEYCFDAIRPRCAAVVEAVFRHERPHLLINMTTRRAEPVYSKERFPRRREWKRRYNTYYPSPRMHAFVARTVIDCISRSPDLRAQLEPEPAGEPTRAP